MMKLHRTDWYNKTKDLVNNGKLIFTGTSAGAMVTSPTLKGVEEIEEDIEIAKKYLIDFGDDEYTGFNFINSQILVHFNNKDYIGDRKRKMEQVNYSHPFIKLNDNQAILIEGDKFQIIDNKY